MPQSLSHTKKKNPLDRDEDFFEHLIDAVDRCVEEEFFKRGVRDAG